jgi:hypothetical protein
MPVADRLSPRRIRGARSVERNAAQGAPLGCGSAEPLSHLVDEGGHSFVGAGALADLAGLELEIEAGHPDLDSRL